MHLALLVPPRIMGPPIAALCVIGTFSVSSEPFDIERLVIFGIAGYLLDKFGNFKKADARARSASTTSAGNLRHPAYLLLQVDQNYLQQHSLPTVCLLRIRLHDFYARELPQPDHWFCRHA